MITLSKIAKLAHVSVSTVSKAFSDSRDISPETRDMILAIAKEHGCFKKYYKAKYPRLVIAVICPEFKSRFYSASLSALQEYLGRYNCDICVAATDFDVKTEAELLKYYDSYTDVDGVIIIGAQSDHSGKYGLPIASVGVCCGGAVGISIDISDAIAKAVGHFVSNGVTDIGYIGESHTAGKLKTIRAVHDLQDRHISITDERFETGGYKAMQVLIDKSSVPRAVICAYDYMAIGAIRCLYDNGMRVPEDVAVIGMDELCESKFLEPPLSSIDCMEDEACRLAADALIKHIHGELTEYKKTLNGKLILRRSSEI